MCFIVLSIYSSLAYFLSILIHSASSAAPSDSAMSEDAWIEPGNVAAVALRVRVAIHP
jgi:hypothetical protein